MSATILLLSSATDIHAHVVEQILQQEGANVLLLDPRDLLSHKLLATIDSQGWKSVLHLPDGRHFPLSDLDSIWYRRPHPIQVDPTQPAHIQTLTQGEARMGWEGLLSSTQAMWINYPKHNETADYKPLQLQVAHDYGLTIPASIITSDPEEVKAFYERHHGDIIYKPIHYGSVKSDAGELVAIYTSKVNAEHLEEVYRVTTSLYLFQEQVHKAFELRINIIGDNITATEIHSPLLDWRRDYSCIHYHLHSLPEDIKQKLLKIVHHLHLHFAAIDVIVTPEGEYVFIELNPNGQFYWLDEKAGTHLCQEMAHFLLHPQKVVPSL